MRFDTYFDLALRPDEDIPRWDALGAVWRMVHGAGARTGVEFAVAFPKWMARGFSLGDTLRIFTQGAQGSETLYDALEDNPRVAQLVQGSRVRGVQDATAYEAYMMRRIPSGVSKTRKSIALDTSLRLQCQARARRIAQNQHLPFVRMRTSAGHLFRLTVERVDAFADQQGRPNGYGLSRATSVVALPRV